MCLYFTTHLNHNRNLHLQKQMPMVPWKSNFVASSLVLSVIFCTRQYLEKRKEKKNSMEVHLVNVIFIEITTQRSFYCIILFVIFVTFSAFMKCWSNLWGLLTPHNNQNPFSYRKIFSWRNYPVKKEALLKRRVKNIILVFWIRLPKPQRNTSFKASL